MQGGDVLFDRKFLQRFGRLRGERGGQRGLAVFVAIDQQQVSGAGQNGFAAGFADVGVAEAEFDRVADATDARVTHVLVAQQGAQVAGGGVHALDQCTVHVDFEQEVHAAAQVETEVHGQGADGGQPVRRGRQQVECHHKARVGCIRVEAALDGVFALQLQVGGLEAGAHAVGVGEDTGVWQLGGAEDLGHARFDLGRFELERGLAAGDLDGGDFAVEVREGVDEPEDQHEADQQVFPEGITVHGRVAWSGVNQKRSGRPGRPYDAKI